jgi:hypothetical protein
MKKIRIITYSDPKKKTDKILDKQYSVFISSEHRLYFPSEVKAQNFLIKISKGFNKLVLELNFYYLEIFKEYRQVWHYVDDASEYSFMINTIEVNFNKLYKNKKSENYNCYVYHDLQKLIMLMSQLAENLEQLNLQTKIYIAQNRCKFILQNLKRLNNNLETLCF